MSAVKVLYVLYTIWSVRSRRLVCSRCSLVCRRTYSIFELVVCAVFESVVIVVLYVRCSVFIYAYYAHDTLSSDYKPNRHLLARNITHHGAEL